MTTDLTQNLIPLSSQQYPNTVTVFIDFDGTIAEHDVTDVLLNHFAAPEWEALETDWLEGKIGARECMAKQIALITATPHALNKTLDAMKIDPAFIQFIQMIKNDNAKIAIVSDGLDYSIKHIFKNYGLSEIEIFANQLVYQGNEKWQINFPYKNNTCPSGHCKCRRYDGLKSSMTVYIGDGASDFCPSEKADMVFAKNKLADYCESNHINHIRVNNFAEIMAYWPHIHIEKPLQKQVAS